MTEWHQPLDIYCERLSQEFWAEPVNALTNVVFLVAAYLFHLRTQKERTRDAALTWLGMLMVTIGLGSFAFHTMANYLTYLMDVIPIGTYMISYLAIFAHYVLKMSWGQIIVLIATFVAFGSVVREVPSDWQFNGTIRYAPAWLYLCGFAAYVFAQSGHVMAKPLYLALIAMLLAMVMRSIDMKVCEDFALGTHFLWHLMNGCVLYYTALSIFLHRQQKVST